LIESLEFRELIKQIRVHASGSQEYLPFEFSELLMLLSHKTKRQELVEDIERFVRTLIQVLELQSEGPRRRDEEAKGTV